MTLYQYSGSQGSQGFQSLPVTTFTFTQNFSLNSISFDNNSITFDNTNQNLISSAPTRAFNYNLTSISDNNLLDYGLITNSVGFLDDYGQISQLSSTTLDYGLTTQSVISTVYPFGGMQLSGSASLIVPADIRTYNAVGSYSLTYSPDDTTGTLFSFGEKIERRTYDYSQSSIETPEDDYGSISNVILFTDEYGSLLDSSNLTEDFGLVSTIDLFSAATPFGKLTIGGSADTEWINKNFYGPLFGTIGQVKVTYSPDDTTGTLFSFGEKIERRTYNYDILSVQNIGQDYGSISNVILFTDEYGSVSNSSTLTEDFGFVSTIDLSSAATPFGKLTIGGSADTEWINKNFYGSTFGTIGQVKVTYSPDDTTGTLFSFGEKIERRSYDYNQSSIENTESDYGSISQITSQTEDYQSITTIHGLVEEFGFITEPTGGLVLPFGTITLSGSAITAVNYRLFFYGSSVEKFVYSPDDTTGTLFSFGEKIERITYSYNKQSIINNIDDYGLVSELTIGGFDYGLITSISGSQPSENYGLISESVVSSISLPFGSLSFSGTSLESEIDSYVGDTATIFISGNVSNVQEADSYKGSGTISLSGTYNNFKYISAWVGSGILFGFGEKVERRTYVYDQNLPATVIEDFGLIINSPTTTIDCGSVNSPVNDGIENYGSLGGAIGVTPFGSLSLSGTALESETDAYIGLGTIFGSGNVSNVQETDSYKGSGTISLSGTALDSSIIGYVGSGILFGFGEKIERRSYAYNKTSVENDEDYGLVSELTIGGTDYGSIAGVGGGQIDDDYGLITQSNITAIPFGSITLSGISSNREIAVYGYYGNDNNPGTSGTIFISGNVSNVQEIDSYKGSGTITLSGIALESESDVYIGLGTIFVSDFGLESEIDVYTASGSISLSGTAVESFSAQTPEDTQLFVISGSASNIKETDSYSGSGSLSLSGIALESESDVYIGLGTIFVSDFGLESEIDVYTASGSISLSGTAVESFSAQTPEDTQLFVISGSASNIKETDSYSGSGTITLSGIALESESDVYIGLGTVVLSDFGRESEIDVYTASGSISLSGTAVESFSAQTPEDTQLFVISDVGVRYYSPIYPRNALIGDPGSGIGTIRLNDDSVLTVTRATLPYKAKGGITLSNGLKESFNKGNYNSSGIVTLSGIASTREIQVYGYYGDQKNPGTSGKITLNEQTTPIIEKYTSSYVGLGTITLSDSFERRRLRAWNGSGTITLSGIGLDSITIPVSNTILFKFSGSKFESFIPTTEIGSGIITITGSSDTPIRTFVHNGSGSIVLNGSAIIRPVLRQIGTGTIRLVPRFRVDDDYTSCDNDTDFSVQFGNTPLLNATSITFDNSNITFDSQIIKSTSTLSVTCDREDDATVKFVANPPEDTILFTISGSSITSVVSLDSYVGIGNIFISGGYTNLRSTKVKVGTGIVTISQLSKDVEIDSYVGLGTILSLSGASKSKIANPPENTILVQIGGTASTRVEFEYSYVGVGTQYFSGIGSQRIVYADRGSGLISLSGNLVYPDIKFVPSPDGSGIISIVGTSKEKSTVVHNIQGGSLFTLYGGFESFSKTNYNGIGTIFIVGAASSIINNPFQPSRVYVTII